MRHESNLYEIRIPARDKHMNLIDDIRVIDARDETIAFLLSYATGAEASITLGYYRMASGKVEREEVHVIRAHVNTDFSNAKDSHGELPQEDIEEHCKYLAKVLNQECVMYSKTPSYYELVSQVSVKDALLSI
jgi:hypothetical protein